jgi:hypothetical protein
LVPPSTVAASSTATAVVVGAFIPVGVGNPASTITSQAFLAPTTAQPPSTSSKTVPRSRGRRLATDARNGSTSTAKSRLHQHRRDRRDDENGGLV